MQSTEGTYTNSISSGGGINGCLSEEEDDCCYAISEGSFVGVGELLCEAGRETEMHRVGHHHRLRVVVAGESGVGKRYGKRP